MTPKQIENIRAIQFYKKQQSKPLTDDVYDEYQREIEKHTQLLKDDTSFMFSESKLEELLKTFIYVQVKPRYKKHVGVNHRSKFHK